jgi:lipopolysaccharide/colanic/teichoic acid biosynthesis glycosyltransferase
MATKDITRIPDVLLSFTGMVVLSPFLLVIACLIKATSKGPVFFAQQRVGLHNKDFIMYKFRTMHQGAAEKNALTIGSRDDRITAIGYYLRKFKLDELPQFYNVLKGDMSIVGPRPELRKYVQLYNSEQQQILSAKPGITDYASIAFRNENDLLASAADPETYYIESILPAKLRLNKKYLENKTLNNYICVIMATLSGNKGFKIK